MAAEAEAKTNLFTKSSNITLDRVMHLFGADKIVPQEDPLFVFVIGSPGVGKTTQTRRYFGKLYDSMYNISLDTIVEHIEPYRKATINAYHNVKRIKTEKGFPSNLENENYADLSSMYLQVIKSDQPIYSSKAEYERVIKKINKKYTQKALNASNASNTINVSNVSKAKSTKAKASKAKSVKTQGGSLLTIMDKAIIEGIKRSYNILYDTTFAADSKGDIKKFDKVLEWIIQSKILYQIVILHITASPETIQRRLKGRHAQMVQEGFLRAIHPKLIPRFVEENKKCYNALKDAYEGNPLFSFEEISNEANTFMKDVLQ
jgi:hypothetical protein